MPDHKRTGDPRPQLANLRKEQLTDLEDVTVLFSPPKELLERTAIREEAKTAVPTAADWDSSEDEATLALPLSDALAKLEPLRDPAGAAKPAPAPVPKPPAQSAHAPAPIPKPLAQPALALKPLAPPLAAPVPVPPAPGNAGPTAPTRLPRIEIGDEDLGAILGPRRKARWLAFGGAVALVVIAIALARLSP